MPLSKARDRERKRLARLEALLPKPVFQPNIPLYNPSIHRPGDTVQVIKGKGMVTTTIPELDADGNPMPDLS